MPAIQEWARLYLKLRLRGLAECWVLWRAKDAYNVCVGADGRHLLAASGDLHLKLWDAITGRYLRELEGHTGHVNSIDISADGSAALAGCDDMKLRLWELESGRCLRTFEGHADLCSRSA